MIPLIVFKHSSDFVLVLKPLLGLIAKSDESV